MNRSSLAGLAGIFVAATAAVSFAAPINIPNFSLENPTVAPGAFSVAPIPNFFKGTDVGVQNIGQFSAVAGQPAAAPGVTDGSQAAFIGNGQAPSNLGTDLTNAGVAGAQSYTFTVALASRGGTATAGVANPGINVGIQNLSAGGAIVTTYVPLSALQTGATAGAPSLTYQNFSVTLPGAGVAAGSNIRLFLDKLNGTPLLLADNFRLNTVVPEPASLGLLGLGGLTLLRRRRTA